MDNQISVDVLIVGSGPVGATFARILHDTVPSVSILMVESGPRLTPLIGQHTKNIADPQKRSDAQVASQGPNRYAYRVPSFKERARAAQSESADFDILARPGTHLVSENSDQLNKSGMPAASLSSNVGGMGVHWTCACPRPGVGERIDLIGEQEWELLFSQAEALLNVNGESYGKSSEGNALLGVLGKIFNANLPSGRKVQTMPLACSVKPDGSRYWTGPEVIFGDLILGSTQNNFEIRSETVCKQIIYSGGRAKGAWVEHFPTGKREFIEAKVVVVAADAIRTPQLLWASWIRPRALGHYLNDQPQIMCAVEIDDSVLRPEGKNVGADTVSKDDTLGVYWLPFDQEHHPFHGQIMHMDLSPLQLNLPDEKTISQKIIGLGWFCRKELRYEDFLEFDDLKRDFFGMPSVTVHYTLTEKDRAEIDRGMKEQSKVALAFGKEVKDGEQFMVPAGSSLHYQGTVRMGDSQDGTSVCNSWSQVWGFENIFVGGNGVIPTSTACNPTLTSVAIAIRACERIREILLTTLSK